jgi:autotransporter-associated beta strand protein
VWFGTYGSWDTQTRKDAADAALTAVCNRLNAYGDFNTGSDGWIDVYYNSSVPTANASWYGAMTFGGTWPGERVALHEANHWLGSVYGHPVDGARTVAALEQFDGIGARLSNDGTHFWPYGLNYDSEWSEVAAQRNVALMYAMRGDWGIGPTSNPTAWAATSVTMTGSDAVNESGFNYGSKWSDNTFAHANADYSTGSFSVRTPQGYKSWKFAGKSLSVNSGGSLLYNGWGTNDTVTINNLILNGGTIKHDQFSQDLFQLAGTISLIGGSAINAANGNIRILSTIGGAGSLTTTGGYTTTLSGANSYTGATTVAAGTLVFASSQSNIGAVTVADGARLQVQAISAGTPTLTTTALTLGNGAASTLAFDFNSLSSATTPLISTGTLTVNGSASIVLQNGALLSTGTYKLVSFSALSGSGTLGGSTIAVGSRGTGILINNGTSALDLNVTNDRPIWTGADSGNWLAASTGANKNWKLQGAGTATDYLSGDNVLFDDSATGATAINISAASVSPAAITFNNSAKTYTISSGGGYGITGITGVTKSGAGTVIFNTANSYTGATTINAGTLSIGANNHLGADAAPVTLNGGTLRTTAGMTGTHAITIGASGGTIHINSTGSGGTGQLFLNTQNSLLGNGSLTVTGSGALNTSGAGNLRVGKTNTYSGYLSIQSGGIFEYEVAGSVASAASFNIGNQGEIAVQSASGVSMPNRILVSGGTNSVLSFENGTAGTASGTITLNANLTVGLRDWYNYSNVRSGSISGRIGGTGGLIVNSGNGAGGVLTLSNVNTFSGGTTVNSSALLVGTANALGTGSLNLNSSTFGTTAALTIPNGIVITGTNTLGQATAQTITLSGALTGSGTLKNLIGTSADANVYFTGNLANFTGTLDYTCQAGSTTEWWRFGTSGSMVDLSKASVIVRIGDVTNTNAFSKNFGFRDGITGATIKIGALSGDGIFQASFSNSGPNTLEVGSLNTSTTFSGVIAGGNAGTNLALNKVGAGTLTLTGSNLYSRNTTILAGTLVLGPAAQSPVLTGAGAVLNGGRLVMQYSGTSPQPTIVGELFANANTGFQSGKVRTSLGIDSTKAIGWLDDGTSTFQARYTHKGDINLSGAVDSQDFNAFVAGYGKTTSATWAEGDTNYDGKVNTIDFNYLAGNFGSAPLSAPGASLGAVVPEPTSCGLIVLAATAPLFMPRRNRTQPTGSAAREICQ